MCLQVNELDHKKRLLPLPWQVGFRPKRAKKPIKCYKQMSSVTLEDEGIFESIVFPKEWTPQVTYTIKMKRVDVFSDEVGPGFHADLTPGSFSNVEMLIPKGAKYFVDDQDHIVANKMMVLKRYEGDPYATVNTLSDSSS